MTLGMTKWITLDQSTWKRKKKGLGERFHLVSL